MEKVTSADGTAIAYDRMGSGPAVVLVCGGSVDRMSNAPLATLLAQNYTVYNYDRRGRGDSGDAAEYAIEREFEDLDAIFAAAGGPACLYGTSSGAALALLATAAGRPVTKLALWEPPYILEGTRERPPADTASIYRAFVAEGRRDKAAEYFMAEVVGMPAEFVAMAKESPWWPAQEAIAHTLAYDATIMGDYSIPAEAAAVTAPTRVFTGGASEDWMKAGNEAVLAALPNATHRVIPDQQHNVDPAALAPALKEFFG
ncbi:alpha-beta hydrolase superfamily lysophospholipase [Kribbella antiqua]|uniref:Alpha-beta hydrolase superfamily lysophospholipase n=1 Tax=Kribbella antiqua TaxID=2512217 RepID=A0A4R2IXE8_9ACTN|nr:alpha/beta hydrolase [Kribbella antiqua]TCO48549.1 alpha-beta hydrolase superfamily lysophospholipase [Kribbella antiqua]